MKAQHLKAMNEETQNFSAERDIRLRAYLSRWQQELVHFDGPLWRAFRALLKSPGRLAAAQCEPLSGHGIASYSIHPIRLYLTINIVFFFLGPWVNTGAGETLQVRVWHVEHAPVVQAQPVFGQWLDRRIESSGVDEVLYQMNFDQTMSAQQGAWVFIWVPILGMASFLIYRRRRRYLVEHLVFATHLMSFFLVLLLIVGIGLRVIFLLPEKTAAILSVLAILSWMMWLVVASYRSLRIFHDLKSHWATIAISAWMMSAFVFGLWIYLRLLFLWTLLSLRSFRIVS